MQVDGLDGLLVCCQGKEDIMQVDGRDGLLPCLLSGHGGHHAGRWSGWTPPLLLSGHGGHHAGRWSG